MRSRLAVLLGLVAGCGYAVVDTIDIHPPDPPTLAKPSTRDKLLSPFAAESIWNTPIGSNAEYIPALMTPPAKVFVEETYFVVAQAGDALRELRLPGPRPDAPCSGTQVVDSLPVPDSFVLTAVANASLANATSLLLPDGHTLRELVDVARCDANGPIFATPSATEDIYGLGLHGSQGGSGMSAVGGSLRVGELTGRTAIRHVLKIIVWGNAYLYIDPTMPASCYRWPADRCDQTASDPGTHGYHGMDPRFVQGTLLALPPQITANQLGLVTLPGVLLFSALQDYGAYVVGSAGADAVQFGFDGTAVVDFQKTYGYEPRGGAAGNEAFAADVRKIVTALDLVANNAPDSVGGGGMPRRDLAPPFSN